MADRVKIRTPLHAVNGYCELLAMTNLTEEQIAYVSSIQQACHAINVIAGNVLGQLLLNIPSFLYDLLHFVASKRFQQGLLFSQK